jgi:hypothetical protein
MSEIMGLIVDAEINTREKASALVEQEAAEMAELYSKPLEEMRKVLLSNIGYATGYLTHAQADRIFELFDTEHPYFGRSHPSPEDALRMGMELGKASRRKKERDNGETIR